MFLVAAVCDLRVFTYLEGGVGREEIVQSGNGEDCRRRPVQVQSLMMQYCAEMILNVQSNDNSLF